MFFTGFSDEAGAHIDAQIRATLALGWKHMEVRETGAGNLSEVGEADFDRIAGKIKDAGLSVNCFGSPIANGRRVKEGEDEYAKAVSELKVALPRMKRLGSTLIRGMSFKLPGPGHHFGTEYEKKVLSTIRDMSRMCADAGVKYAHENCSGYGSLSPEHSLRLVEAADPNGFTLAFDTGNPVGSRWVKGEAPYPALSTWDFYQKVKAHVTYIHLKDAYMADAGSVKEDGIHPGGYVASKESSDTGAQVKIHVFPGEGQGSMKEIIADLFARGYDGGFSIEPHVKAPQHTARPFPFPGESERFNMYVSYGRAAEALVRGIRGRS